MQRSARPHPVGSDKQLFIDDLLIASQRDVRLTLNPPRKSVERCLWAEHPWEAFYAGGWNTALELNIDTGALGSVRVELLDESLRVLPGFAATACDPVRGNSVRRRVTWRGSSALGSIADRPVRLRFTLAGAKLYAFQFRNG